MANSNHPADLLSTTTAIAREAGELLMGYFRNRVKIEYKGAADLVTVAAGIEDAVGLVQTELSFRGFTVVNPIGDVPGELPRSLMRNVFMAALMALTDRAAAPANVVLSAQLAGNELVLTISIQPVQGELLPGGVPSYRNLEWEDVEALAELESVRLIRTADQVELHCPVALESSAAV